jgi:hypothetical protein
MRLSPARRFTLYAVGLGVWLTGSLWLLFHYFPQPGLAAPLAVWCLKLHGAFGFAAIWLFGLLWAAHIVASWSGRRHRITGGLLVIAIGWLLLSGYLLYYLGDENVRARISQLHWGIGLTIPLAFAAHRLMPLRRDRRPSRDNAGLHRGSPFATSSRECGMRPLHRRIR